MDKLLKKIEEKIGIPGITARIDEALSSSELNSFLMELFNLRVKKIKPSQLLTVYTQNRFCLPSKVDITQFKEYEITLLKIAEQKGFNPVQLSPLAPLGTCSAVAFVNQNNIVSALRGTEVVSDAANVLAIKTADDIKSKGSTNLVKYSTVHRHVRGQSFTNPAFSAHFGVFCMTTGGIDKGSFSFEAEQLLDHIEFYRSSLSNTFDADDLLLRIYLDKNSPEFNNKIKQHLENFSEKTGSNIEYLEKKNNYYDLVQFKYFLNYKDEWVNLADGGFVNWLQKLLENKKLRMIISGLGTELSYKIINSLI